MFALTLTVLAMVYSEVAAGSGGDEDEWIVVL